jgi:hypothetical protein
VDRRGVDKRTGSAPARPSRPKQEDRQVITLSLKDDGSFIGTIGEADMQVLREVLEEESSEDTDYYIDPATIDLLGRNGAGERLLALLRKAVGDSEGVEIVWSEE